MNMLSAASNINWWAVLVAALTSSVLGGLWFAALFAKPYAVALGRQDQPKEKPAPIFFVGPFVCGLIVVIASALLIETLDIRTISTAIEFGLVIGVGYLAATTMNTAINPNFPRPLYYGAISSGYFVLTSIAVSIILVAMR
jgi:hypothetical protein